MSDGLISRANSSTPDHYRLERTGDAENYRCSVERKKWMQRYDLRGIDLSRLADGHFRLLSDVEQPAPPQIPATRADPRRHDRTGDAAVVINAGHHFGNKPTTTDARDLVVDRRTAEPEKRARIDSLHHRSVSSATNPIQQYCELRNIKTLVHFTAVSNLSSILRHGLRTRAELERAPYRNRVVFNDVHRLDDLRNSVSLSISFPNYRMFYKYRIGSARDWVVLTLHPSILWERDCAFCTGNAASNSVRRLSLDERRSPQMLEAMFEGVPRASRSALAIPGNFPTDPQAEVLVLESIGAHYIMKVCFENCAAMRTWMADSAIHTKAQIGIDTRWFRPRCDYQYWQGVGEESAAKESSISSADADIPF